MKEKSETGLVTSPIHDLTTLTVRRLGNFFKGGRGFGTSKPSNTISKDNPAAKIGAQTAWNDAERGKSQQNNGPQYNGPQYNGAQINGPQYNGPQPNVSAAARGLYGPQMTQNEQWTGPPRRDSDVNSVTPPKEKGRMRRIKDKVRIGGGKNKNEQSSGQVSPEEQSRPPLTHPNLPQYYQSQIGGQRTEGGRWSEGMEVQTTHVPYQHNASSYIPSARKALPATPSDGNSNLLFQGPQIQSTDGVRGPTGHEQNNGEGINNANSTMRQVTQQSEKEFPDKGSHTGVECGIPSNETSNGRNINSNGASLANSVPNAEPSSLAPMPSASSTPLQKTGPQRTTSSGSDGSEDESNPVIDKIARYLQGVRIENSSLPLEKDLKRPFSLLNIESALKTIVETYVALYQDEELLKQTMDTTKKNYTDLQADHKMLEDTTAEKYKDLQASHKEQNRQSAKKITKLEEEQKVAKLGHESQVSFFRGEIQKEQDKRETDLHRLRDRFQIEKEAILADHKTTIEAWGDKVDLLERKVNTLENQLQEQSIADKQAADARLEDLTRELKDTLRQSEAALDATTRACQLQVEAAKKALADEQAQSVYDLATRQDQLEHNFKLERARLEQEYQDELNWKTTEYKTTVGDLEGKLDQIVKEKSQEISKMKADHDKEKVKMYKDSVDQDRLVKEDHQRAMGTAAREYQKTIDNWEIKAGNIQLQLNQEKDGKAREIQALKGIHEKEKLDLTGRWKAEMEVYKRALVKREHFKALSDHEVALRFQDISTEVDDLARVDWEKRQELRWPFDDYALRKAENPRRTKQYVIQNTLWVVLYEKIFCSPFRVMGDKGRSLEKEWIKKYGQGNFYWTIVFIF